MKSTFIGLIFSFFGSAVFFKKNNMETNTLTFRFFLSFELLDFKRNFSIFKIICLTFTVSVDPSLVLNNMF